MFKLRNAQEIYDEAQNVLPAGAGMAARMLLGYEAVRAARQSEKDFCEREGIDWESVPEAAYGEEYDF